MPERDRSDTESNKVMINLQGSSFHSSRLALKKTLPCPRWVRNVSSSAFVANSSLHQRNQTVSQDPIALFKAFHTSSLWQSSKIMNYLIVRGWYSTAISLLLWRGAVQEAPDLLPLPVLLRVFCYRGKRREHRVRKYRTFRIFAPETALHKPEKPWKEKILFLMRRLHLWVWSFILFWLRVQGWFSFIRQFFLLLCFIFSRDSSDSRAVIEILDTKCKGNESHFKLPKDISITWLKSPAVFSSSSPYRLRDKVHFWQRQMLFVAHLPSDQPLF